jgi:hypothetical protein
MTASLNYWHYIFLGIAFIIFLFGIFSALRQTKKSLIFPMIVSTVLVSSLLAVFSVLVVDKYTKKVKLLKIDNKRLLSTEQIVYTGVVQNVGNHEIGVVTLEIKLVNKGHTTGNVKGENFYKPSGFFDFFSNGMGIIDNSKPQKVVQEFVIATNLQPGDTKHFRVYFKFPGYFRSVADFIELNAK